MGGICSPFLEIKWEKERKCHAGPLPGAPTVGVPTRGSGSQLVNAACFLVLDNDARGNTVTHGLSWFRPRGRTSSKGGVRGALYYLAPGVLVVGDTSEVREGGKLPSLC